MNPIRSATVLLALSYAASIPAPSFAQQSEHRLGEHPAVIGKRLAEHQGYDYASKFYPHPAWLYLSAEPPRATEQRPSIAASSRDRPGAPGSSDKSSEANPVAAVPKG